MDKKVAEFKITKKTQRVLRAKFDKLNASNYMMPIPLVEEVYDAIDIFYGREIKSKVVCKSGCYHCCLVPVEVTNLEAYYIEQKTGHKIEKLIKSQTMPPTRGGVSCPFLKDNKCSIYKYRPAACRAFGTFDSAEYCKKGGHVSHTVTSLFANGATMEFYKFLIRGAETVQREHGIAQYADIRHWFKGIDK